MEIYRISTKDGEYYLVIADHIDQARGYVHQKLKDEATASQSPVFPKRRGLHNPGPVSWVETTAEENARQNIARFEKEYTEVEVFELREGVIHQGYEGY